MYQNLKLEKGLYHLTNKSFVQALEALDPSAQYADTPLAGLDAYERQLKRFDIRISGAQCDRVEKFFTSTESAVLFPEFVRRAVQQGIDASMLSDLTAVETHTDSSQYLGCTITETDAYGTVAQGAAMTSSTILEATTALTLNKYGRLVKASYEAVRRQRLDVFAVLLKSVGMQLGQALMQQRYAVQLIAQHVVHPAQQRRGFGREQVYIRLCVKGWQCVGLQRPRHPLRKIQYL